jgi:hypothetical protein
MFGWGKKKVDLSGVRREPDRAILEQLLKHGDDLSRPRHTLMFFYRIKNDDRPRGALFDGLIASAASIGLSVGRNDDDGLVLEGEMFVDPARLNDLIGWAEREAAIAGVEFDGWECAIDKGA